MIIKKNWNEVTISEYQEICSITSENDLERSIEIISILTGETSEDIRKCPLSDFYTFLEEVKFVSTSPDADVNKTFMLDGIEYGIIPNLNFISTGEWLDAEQWKDQPIENMHLYAALLFRPIIFNNNIYYTIEEHKTEGFFERAELFKDRLSVNKIFGAQFFFSVIGLEFMMNLADYSAENRKVKKVKRTKKPTLKKKTTQQVTKRNSKKPSKNSGIGTI